MIRFFLISVLVLVFSPGHTERSPVVGDDLIGVCIRCKDICAPYAVRRCASHFATDECECSDQLARPDAGTSP